MRGGGEVGFVEEDGACDVGLPRGDEVAVDEGGLEVGFDGEADEELVDVADDGFGFASLSFVEGVFARVDGFDDGAAVFAVADEDAVVDGDVVAVFAPVAGVQLAVLADDDFVAVVGDDDGGFAVGLFEAAFALCVDAAVLLVAEFAAHVCHRCVFGIFSHE